MAINQEGLREEPDFEVPRRGTGSVRTVAAAEVMNADRHYSGVEIQAFIDGDSGQVDLAAVQRHVQACADCASTHDALLHFEDLLAEAFRTPIPSNSEITSRERLFARLLSASNVPAGIAELRAMPFLQWPDHVRTHPEVASEAVIRELVDAAIIDYDRDAENALHLLDAANQCASLLGDGTATVEWKSDILKNRANALRMLGRYSDALRSLDEAERFATFSQTGAFVLAQVLYTRGTVLVKMGLLDEALAAAQKAELQFSEFGDRRRMAHSQTLAAAVLNEKGDVAASLAILLRLRSLFESLTDDDGIARVTANISVAYLRLGGIAQARRYAQEGRRMYSARKMPSEIVRLDWQEARILLAEGDRESGMDKLLNTAAAFESLGMPADAGFVKLNITEEHVVAAEWEAAEAFARDAAQTFQKAGGTLRMMEALAHLRMAVEKRIATRDLVQYVSRFIANDHAGRPFLPSEAGL